MENYEKMFYYHIRTNQKNIVKGEYDKQKSKFVFYIMKYKGDSKLEFKIPINMKQFRFDLCLAIDLKNFLVSMKSCDKKYIKSDSLNSVKISWNMAHSKKSEVFSEQKIKNLITLYDKFDYKIFSEIKRPIRGLIKRCIFNKIFTINSFFEEIQSNQIDSFYSIHENYNELKYYFQDKISNSLISNDIQSNPIFYEKFIEELNQKLFLKIEELLNLILLKLSEIEKKLFSTLFKKEFSYIVDETFQYEECEKHSQNSNPINFLMFYNFNKQSESILKIKNSDIFLVYMKNKNQPEYYTLRNTSNNHSIKINKDSDSFMIIRDNIIFNYNFSKGTFYLGEGNNNEEKEGLGFEGIFRNKVDIDGIYSYFGNYKKNHYDGIGIFDNSKYLYKGNFISGKKSGKCEIYLKNEKEIYVGEIKENVLEGKGKYFYNSNSNELLYHGNVSSNSPNGKGKIIYNNLDCFEGEFDYCIKKNSGVYTNKMKDSVSLNYDEEGIEKKEETVYNY